MAASEPGSGPLTCTLAVTVTVPRHHAVMVILTHLETRMSIGYCLATTARARMRRAVT